jgi:hypothetical protein
MATNYPSSADFINNLAFDYIETYSLLRGAEYEENEQRLRDEYDQLRVKKNTNTLTSGEEERFYALQDQLVRQHYLINASGQFHFSSKKTNTFSGNDPIVERLKQILNTEVREMPRFLCEAIYRDAVVFYNNKQEIVSVLNVCLGCNHMAGKSGPISADYETYDLLKRFFLDMGHDVEKPDYFIWEDMKKQSEKYRKHRPNHGKL